MAERTSSLQTRVSLTLWLRKGFMEACGCCNGGCSDVAGAGAPGGGNMVKMEARVSGCVEMKMMTWKNVISSNSLVEIKPT